MTDEPRGIQALRAVLAVVEARAAGEAAEAARERAVVANAEALIAAQKLEIEKLRRALYGVRSERKARLLDQLVLKLEELEAAATEDELAAERAAAQAKTPVRAFERRRPARKPFPEHLPRERVVIEAPAACDGAARQSLQQRDGREPGGRPRRPQASTQWPTRPSRMSRSSSRSSSTIPRPVRRENAPTPVKTA